MVGSSNFSRAGLCGDPGLNLGHPVVGKVEAWYDELWRRAVPFDLAALFERLAADYPPYLIFLRMLYELDGDELGRPPRRRPQAGRAGRGAGPDRRPGGEGRHRRGRPAPQA